MKRLMDIDLLDDADLQRRMVQGSMVILVVGIAFGLLGALVLPHEPVDLLWFAALVLASLLVLPVHELVHAAAFKLVSGFRAHISFGFSSWMLYTTAPGCMLPRGPFCAVLLAPTILVTSVLLVLPALWGMPLLGWFLAVVHLAGCTGDLGYVRIIASETSANLVVDTERGIALFHDA